MLFFFKVDTNSVKGKRNAATIQHRKYHRQYTLVKSGLGIH